MKTVVKQIIALSVMYAILFQFGVQLKTVIHYQLNKEALTAQYCVNKDAPELSCLARCYLAKELKTQEKPTEEESVPASSETSFKFSVLYFVRYSLAPWVIPSADKTMQAGSQYIGLIAQEWVSTLFQPPMHNIFGIWMPCNLNKI